MSEEKNTWWDNVQWIFWLPIMVPIALLFLALALPFILYHVVILSPIDSRKRKKFLTRNEGRFVLCISTGSKYKEFKNKYMDQIMEIGVADVVVFDATISPNQYDGYVWDQLVHRELGFPILVQFYSGARQKSLKIEFQAFFRKEIDLVQLLGSIKQKMNQH